MLWWFAQSTLIAGGLALVAALAGRWKRLGPEARHVLWLVVLIKLAIPPVLAWPWSVPETWPARVESAPVHAFEPPIVVAETAIPKLEDLPETQTQTEALTEPEPDPVVELPPSPSEITIAQAPPETQEVLPPIEPRPEPQGPPPAGRTETLRSALGNYGPSALLALWLAGSVAVVARRGIKVARFHRSLAGSRAAPDWLVEEARAIGERVGVRPPKIVTTSDVNTPLLWCLGRPRLILPEALIKRLEADRWPGILAHELAHLARRDHWVVRLELLVEAAWWWNPLFWHTRRRIHEEAEQACDARVVRSMPERRFAYAEALVDVCEHLARLKIPSPALGVGGAGASRSLEGRLLMILRDPIPHRPSRRGALAALLLAALALPAWTLGQQPESSPKPDAAPKSESAPKPDPAPKPEAAPRPDLAPKAEPAAGPLAAPRPDAAPSPFIAPTPAAEPPKPDVGSPSGISFEQVRDGFWKRHGSLKNLAMRYVVASRSEGTWEQGRLHRVQVEAADVLYAFLPDHQAQSPPVLGSRLDVFEAKPASPPKSGDASPAVSWSRWLEIRTVGDAKSLRVDSTTKSPARFRWQALGPQDPNMGGGNLSFLFTRDSSLLAGAVAPPLPMINTPAHRPLAVLDLEGSSPWILGWNLVQASVAGVDSIGGREAVRVAWISRGQDQVRGICWVAPSLDFAIVRSEAFVNFSRDPSRWAWRKNAEDFNRVGNLWLPGKVTTRLSQIKADGKATVVREQVVTLEDYRVNAEPAPDAFQDKFPIQALDEKTGDFTTLPPEPSPGLVARLERAVRESSFGPPIEETTKPEIKVTLPLPAAVEEPESVKLPPQTFGSGVPASALPVPSSTPNPRAYADIVKNVDEAPTGRMNPANPQPRRAIGVNPPADTARLDPGIIAKPASGFEDAMPVARPKAENPIPLKAPDDQAAIERRFKADPEVIDLGEKLDAAKKKLDEARRVTARRDDPAEQAALRKWQLLQKQYDDLWEAKSKEYRQSIPDARDEVSLLQFRLDGKNAEVKKAEAQLTLADKDWKRAQVLMTRSAIDRESVDRIEAALKIAEAEVAQKKSERDEVEFILNQARRRLGSPEVPNPSPKGAEPPNSTSALPEFRDAVELMAAQLQGKQAELRGAESNAHLARLQADRIKGLADRNAVEPKLADETEAKARSAESGLDAKKAEVLEFEIRLKQAKRRAEAEESRLKGDLERAKDRFKWSEDMFKKGFVSRATYLADKSAFDQLMRQLDPKYVPAPAPAREPDPSPDPKDAPSKP